MSLELSGNRSEIVVERSIKEAKRVKEAVPINEATGVIVCGGWGSRLRDVAKGRVVKSLLPLDYDKVIIDNPLINMRRAGIKNIYFVTAEHVIDSIRPHTRANRNDYYGVRFFVDDQPPTGILPLLKKFLGETGLQRPMIKANGDEIYSSIDIRAIYESHVNRRQSITGLLTDNVESAEKYKIWVDRNRNVTRIEKKPFLSNDTTGYYQTGLWVIDPSQFALVQASDSSVDLLNKAYERKNLYGYPTHVRFLNVNTPADLKKAQLREQQA